MTAHNRTGVRKMTKASTSNSVKSPLKTTNGHIQIIEVNTVAKILPVLGKCKNNQLPIPNWITLAKKLEKGTQVKPAATDDITPNIQ